MQFIKKYWPILLIFLLSLIPLLWFKPGLIIAGGDESILLNPGSMIKSTFYAWNPVFNGGNPVGDYQGNVAHLFPFVLFWFILTKIGLSLIMIEKLWFIATWFFSGMGIYYLVNVLIKDKKKATQIALFSVTLYLFNLFIMQYPLMYTVRLPLMVTPWMLAFTIKGLEENKFKYAILFGLVSLFGASGWVNPPAAVIMILIPFAYLIFYIINKKTFFKPIIFFAQLMLCFMLVNLYWIWPFLLNLLSSSANIKETNAVAFFGTTSAFDTLRFLGAWAFREFSYKLPYFSFNSIYYNNAYFIIGSYALIIISLIGLTFIKKLRNNINIIFFFLVFVCAIFVAKGSQSPFGSIYIFMQKYIPGFWVFREPYAKFMPIITLCVAILFGYSSYLLIDFITNKIKDKTFKSIVNIGLSSLVIAFVVSISCPLIKGESIWNKTDGPARPYFTQIPEYWNELKNYLNTHDKESTVLMLPKNNTNSTTYNWESGYTLKGSAASYIIPNPYFYFQHVPIYDNEIMVQNIYQEVAKQKDNLAQKLGNFGIKYILNQRDVSNEYISNEAIADSTKVNSYLINHDNLEEVATFDKLDLWQINDDAQLPKIFTNNMPLYLESKNIQDKILPLMDIELADNINNTIISDSNRSPLSTINVQGFSLLDNNVEIKDRDIMISFDPLRPKEYQLFFSSYNELKGTNILLDEKNITSDANLIKHEQIQQQYKVELPKLDQSKHQITFSSAIEPIDLDDASFEEIDDIKINEPKNNWELIDTTETTPGEYSLEATGYYDAIDGKKSLKITALGHTAGVRQQIKLEKGKKYILNFYYKNYDKQTTSYNIEFLDNNQKTLQDGKSINENLPLSYGVWSKHTISFEASSDQMYLYFYARGSKDKQTIGIDNVSLSQTNINPDLIIIKENKTSNGEIKKINFTKINSTKYIADINTTEPFFLNFLESFNPGWQVSYLENNKKIVIDNSNHYMLNGFANAWQIDKTGSYQVIIEFKNQKTQTTLYIISGIAIFLGLFYVAKTKQK